MESQYFKASREKLWKGDDKEMKPLHSERKVSAT